MSIHDFYSRFASEGERNKLFAALRRLSRLDSKGLFSTYQAEEEPARGWPVWDEGASRRQVTRLLAAMA